MINYEVGQKYRVSALMGRRKTDNKITGELIQHNKNHFTLQDERGIRECFLKADIITGEYGITAL